MAIKISKNKIFENIINFIIFFCFFEPSYFRRFPIIHLIYTYLRYFSLVLIIYKCRKIKIRSYLTKIGPIILYFLMQLLSTMINNGNYRSELLGDLQIILPCVYIMQIIDKNKIDELKILILIIFILLSIQVLTIVMFPNGLYIETRYNRYPYWFWSDAGHMSSLAFCFSILVALFYEICNNKKYKYLLVVHTIVFGFLFGFYFKDYGNFLGFIVISLGCLFNLLLSRFEFIRVFYNPYIIIIFVIFVNIGLLFFDLNVRFSYFIVNILGKSNDLSGRTGIWQAAIYNIQNNFIWGRGLPSSFGMAGWNYIGLNYYASHNQLLEIFVDGGVITFSVFLLLLFFCTFSLNNCKSPTIKILLSFGLLGFYITMLADTISPMLPFFIVLVFILNSQQLNSCI